MALVLIYGGRLAGVKNKRDGGALFRGGGAYAFRVLRVIYIGDVVGRGFLLYIMAEFLRRVTGAGRAF